jgi:hypothetical protein
LPGSNGFRPDLLESVPYQVGEREIYAVLQHLALLGLIQFRR